jgi:AhpD family alkylhydroperoxidase
MNQRKTDSNKGGNVMLLTKLRFELIERMSVKTMRYVSAVPRAKADGLVARIYDMIAEDFFINGSLTSHSKVPPLLAGVWTGGRESILVADRLDRTTKEAMTAVLSRVNDCLYCGDMLVSLVHGGGKHEAASQIFSRKEEEIADPILRERLEWVKAVATPGSRPPADTPFAAEQLPEVIGSLLAMSHINRFSHVVMAGSPLKAPLGFQRIKSAALRMFGSVLKTTTERPIQPGRALDLLPPAPLPDDMYWAEPNPRIASALSRWAGVVERESALVVQPHIRNLVYNNLQCWEGEPMPISRSWVDKEVEGLTGRDRAIARFALVLAKAPYQVDEALVGEILREDRDETRFIRVLAWASFSAARRIAKRVADTVRGPATEDEKRKKKKEA